MDIAGRLAASALAASLTTHAVSAARAADLDAATPTLERCSLVLQFPTRTDSYVVLRATRDSASDGSYYSSLGSAPARTAPPSGQNEPVVLGQSRAPRRREVFGQIMEVVSAAGDGASALRRRQRVLVVWWQLSASCGRAYPRQALLAEPGELFLQLSPRDSADWVSGMPTFDIGVRTLSYFPRGLRLGDAPAPRSQMNMREFLELYRALPAHAAWEQDPAESLKPLITWAESNPRLAAKSPAAWYVCSARVTVEHRMTPCRVDSVSSP